jgi:hypothetical protein
MILRRTEFAREDSTEGGRLASMLDEVRGSQDSDKKCGEKG